jgi:uncharacterized membrane protein
MIVTKIILRKGERMRHRVTLIAASLGTAVAVSVFAPSALGDSPANSPEPVAGTPSCNGLIIAGFNHESGADGPSGNPTSSAGPGPFFGPGTHDAIQTLAREPNCTP